jgi:hypothetical protein
MLLEFSPSEFPLSKLNPNISPLSRHIAIFMALSHLTEAGLAAPPMRGRHVDKYELEENHILNFTAPIPMKDA